LEERLPDELAKVISAVVTFADPVTAGLAWDPATGTCSSIPDHR
jgi:hypothetical protein